MDGILQVTIKNGNIKVMIPLSKVCSILECDDGTAFIETGFDAKRGESAGVFTQETYESIKRIFAKYVLFS